MLGFGTNLGGLPAYVPGFVLLSLTNLYAIATPF